MMNLEQLTRKVKSNTLENITTIVMIVISIFLFMQIFAIQQDELKALIQYLVQVNITAALAIAALVASIGTFRWDHYIKALKAEGMEDAEERRIYILKNAKNPLYMVLGLNSIFVLINLVILFTGTFLDNHAIYLLFFKVDSAEFWLWTCRFLVLVVMALLIGLTYYAMKYMKELLYR